jgi:sulfoxide reductase heme-binding subunit YedZ
MRNLTAAHSKRVKLVIFLLALLPLLRLIERGVHDNLSANPLEFITRATGDWAMYFLCLTLLITPLRRLTQMNWLLRLRRLLGLYVFFYAVLHFLCFLWFDHFFDLEEIGKDILKRPFIAVGFTALVLLVPLVVTSTDRMMRQLGRWWGRLHGWPFSRRLDVRHDARRLGRRMALPHALSDHSALRRAPCPLHPPVAAQPAVGS